jgi:arsenite methyltransferase
MKTIQVFDKPMCCSSGVCGPQVDPVLPRFAADLDWLKGQGHSVERFNLAQQPAAFTENRDVRQVLETDGMDCLPLIVVDGQIVSRGEYPSRDTLALWMGAKSSPPLLVVQPENKCCGGSGCC